MKEKEKEKEEDKEMKKEKESLIVSRIPRGDGGGLGGARARGELGTGEGVEWQAE